MILLYTFIDKKKNKKSENKLTTSVTILFSHSIFKKIGIACPES